MDRITHYARELLAADRAVVCLADPNRPPKSRGHASRADGHRRRRPRLPARPRSARARTTTATRSARSCRPGRTRSGSPGPSAVRGSCSASCASRARRTAPSREAERTLLGALADMAAIAVRTARLHETEEQMTILSERDRIARELHDSLAQVLGQIHLVLRGLEARTDGAAISGDLAELADVADEAYRDVRETILGLRESIPSDGGLEAALRAYLAKYSRQTGIAAHLDCDGMAGRSLSPKAEVQLLRVVQEALTNVRKHAGATEVRVELAERDGMPVLSVTDDGSGFDPTSVGPSLTGGFGLRSMRERVELAGRHTGRPHCARQRDADRGQTSPGGPACRSHRDFACCSLTISRSSARRWRA